MTRSRGVMVYPMPEEVGGPHVFGHYALLCNVDEEDGYAPFTEVRMVHTEGVGYKVDADTPWCWTDYSDTAKKWTLDELTDLVLTLKAQDKGVDLADWVRSHNHRLESNFHQLYRWAFTPRAQD
jgi:hypothetical protein